MIDLSKTIVLDTETTGTRKDDEVISLAIVDGFGERIFYDRIMPTRHTSWPEAEAINGIGWQDVQGKWTIGQLAPYLAALIEQADLVVGYNVTFDLRMLRQSGLDFKWVEAYDVMRELADEHNDGKWLKLEEAATVFGYRHERAHDALEDARATLYLFWLLSGGHARFMRDTCLLGVPVEEALRRQQREGRVERGCLGATKAILLMPLLAVCLGIWWAVDAISGNVVLASLIAGALCVPAVGAILATKPGG